MQTLIIALTVWIVVSNAINAPQQKALEAKRAEKIQQINMLMDRMMKDGVEYKE